MFCLGIDPPLFLVVLSNLCHFFYPIALAAAFVAVGSAFLFPEHRRFVVFMSIGALVLLLEPIAFMWRMLVSLIATFNSESGAAFFVFVVYILLPVSLPVVALWLIRERQYGIS